MQPVWRDIFIIERPLSRNNEVAGKRKIKVKDNYFSIVKIKYERKGQKEYWGGCSSFSFKCDFNNKKTILTLLGCTCQLLRFPCLCKVLRSEMTSVS